MDEKRILAFKREILSVCKKHKISISHEDSQGGFLMVPYNSNDVAWFMEAYIPNYAKEKWGMEQ